MTVAYLFDTDAISELLRRRPALAYLRWISEISRDDQFTSSVCLAEMYEGAYRLPGATEHLSRITERVLPAITVLPFDAATAECCGRIQAALGASGRSIADADAMIAATAIFHGLTLVTGNLRHFARVPGLAIDPVLSDARRS